MEYVAILIIAAAVFGICFLLDKGFTKTFRGTKQHKSGLSVRLNKRYGSIGLIIAVLGVACMVMGFGAGWLLPVVGAVLLLAGAALVVYYMTFGIYYDKDGFVLTTFGKRSSLYRYSDIVAQQLYTGNANVIIELYMRDARAVQLHAAMDGAYDFLDSAFDYWLVQTGKTLEDCPFHNKEQSCWFPPVEE